MFAGNYRIKKMRDYNYYIDNYGNVYNNIGRKLAPDVNIHGYLKVQLFKNGRRRWFLIHRLVAEYFVSPEIDGMDVHHRDRDRMNNYYKNLQVFPRLHHMAEFHGWQKLSE